jgi:hypothetical protein
VSAWTTKSSESLTGHTTPCLPGLAPPAILVVFRLLTHTQNTGHVYDIPVTSNYTYAIQTINDTKTDRQIKVRYSHTKEHEITWLLGGVPS